MLGRIRAAPSPVECLELERPPPKLLKNDSLSLYEATLAKLRQGSQRSLITESSGTVSSEDSSGVSVLCSDISGNQEPKRGREVSIHYLFSKYATSHQNQGSSSSSGSPVSVASASFSDSESPACAKLQF